MSDCSRGMHASSTTQPDGRGAAIYGGWGAGRDPRELALKFCTSG